jgi:hypothetical protein
VNRLGFLALIVVALYCSYLAVLFISQRNLFYPGVQIRVPAEPPVTSGLERLLLDNHTGSVEALFLPAISTPSGQRQPVLVFGHGNGEVVDYWVTALDGFRQRGIGVLLVEYPGYGRSNGETTEDSIRTAMVLAYDKIVADPRVDPSRVFGFGQSLGAAAVCLLSRERPIRALILQSTFPSLAMFASRYLAPSAILRDYYDNEAALKAFQGPVLVIHGRSDNVIPYRFGQQLAAVAKRATFKLYDCGHVCWDPVRHPFWHDVDPFLRQAGIQ